MMDKRKLDGTVDKFSAQQQIHKFDAVVLYISEGKSGALHLTEAGRKNAGNFYCIIFCFV